MNEPFMKNKPFIKTIIMVCCSKCNHNCGHIHVSELIKTPEKDTKYLCPSCGLKFSFDVTLDKREDIKYGLAKIQEGKKLFSQSVECFRLAQKLIGGYD